MTTGETTTLSVKMSAISMATFMQEIIGSCQRDLKRRASASRGSKTPMVNLALNGL